MAATLDLTKAKLRKKACYDVALAFYLLFPLVLPLSPQRVSQRAQGLVVYFVLLASCTLWQTIGSELLGCLSCERLEVFDEMGLVKIARLMPRFCRIGIEQGRCKK